MTQMRSALCMVLRRWAIIRTVRPVVALSNASWTTRSDSASNALVASSRIKMLGFLIRARAIAIRCFWPPDRVTPRSPEDLTFSKKNIWTFIDFIVGYIFNCSENTLIFDLFLILFNSAYQPRCCIDPGILWWNYEHWLVWQQSWPQRLWHWAFQTWCSPSLRYQKEQVPVIMRKLNYKTDLFPTYKTQRES